MSCFLEEADPVISMVNFEMMCIKMICIKKVQVAPYEGSNDLSTAEEKKHCGTTPTGKTSISREDLRKYTLI